MVSGEVKMSSLTRFIWVSVFIFGCMASEPDAPNEYLIRVGNRVMTVADFNRTFELAKAAYPHNVLQNEAVLRIIRSRFLSQITEEMILMQRADEIQVSVTDEELEKAISDIKRDYPDGVFNQTLLEYAVPYPSWKQGLKIRLLKEKVVAKELLENVRISAEDISKYIEKHVNSEEDDLNFREGSKDLNEAIIHRLRREKAEAAYRSWIKNLQEKYTIEINRAQWEKIASS